MKKAIKGWMATVLGSFALFFLMLCGASPTLGGNLSQEPLFLTQDVPPLNLIVLGRDHKLYYEAYNDASDLNDDGQLDIRYDPAIDYYGYFDSHKCYTYDGSESPPRFEPTSMSADKTCSGAGEWSGDFLNYLTTARIDALRKVLYGGYRKVDDADETVLERSHIPQDAHSWGKEYASVAVDGYDIRDYTPLVLPDTNTRHLFANTTLRSDDSIPRLRVLTNSSYRIWEWVSKESPVAGSKCDDGSGDKDCASVAATYWEIVPATMLQNLTQTTYDTTGYTSSPADHAAYEAVVSTYGIDSKKFGQGSASTIDGSGNPFGEEANDQENYLTVFQGDIVVPEDDTYTFAVDGDDAVELMIDGSVVASYYEAHSKCNCHSHSGSVYLTAGNHSLEFRHHERTGGDYYYLYWQYAATASTMTDYAVRAEVCKSGMLEENCRQYTDDSGTDHYKPIGLLQEYGEDDRMMFGLLTGSYTKNTSGGVLRKKVTSFMDEVDLKTGQFTAVNGIVKTIDKLRTVGFSTSLTYNQNCGSNGWLASRPIEQGECRMWGNPISEMMYEGLRYFSGKASPTPAFNIASTGNDDASLGLPLASWDDPFAEGNYEYCAKPFQLVISDINPSYDTDQLPKSYFESFSGDVSALDVSSIGQDIWDHEYGTALNVFIGESGLTKDGAPTPKSASSFGSVRGLAPEEPTKLGGYYAGSISLFAHQNDISNAEDDQSMTTFAVALASPLPQVKIPVGGSTVTLIPFAKSVGGGYSIDPSQGSFQPTNTIVDFYVESLTPTSGKFRINFEDVEQGADHDMDAIVEYSYEVLDDSTVNVRLDSSYASGSIIQHLGYVVSGTTADGTYLEVRDYDTSSGSDPDYFLDTPPGQVPGIGWDDSQPLPLTASRTFTASGSGSGSFLKNPLWYAAKYGNFKDLNENGYPDDGEWDGDGDGQPDNYFLVTNALTLNEQLTEAFSTILGMTSSAAAIATNSTRLDTDTLVYQARFDSGGWFGQLLAYPVNEDGSIGLARWDAGNLIPTAAERHIYTLNPDTGSIPFTWTASGTQLHALQQAALNQSGGGAVDGLGKERLNYLRGSQTDEQKKGGVFRDRSRLLGDIVNSDPWFVGSQVFNYSGLPGTEGTSYGSFISSDVFKNRTRMLYVGANDGMLHAFDAGSGEEKFAYVPLGVYPNLSALSDPTYEHRYYVDGSPRAADACIDLNGDGIAEWRTILLGTLGAGGRTVFALDVTDPDNFGADDVLWECSHADLGATIGQAFAVRMADGHWAAVFGNGYNSDSHKAVLFIVDLEDGTLIKAIDTGADGSEANSNGLATPAPVDYDWDGIVDAVYAGDLYGNMWKFDVSATNTNSWGVALKQGSNPIPLFIARGPSGEVQPITSRPEVGYGPDQTAQEVMVYFGTGKYFEQFDNVVGTSPDVQSFYGIRDSRDNNAAISETDRSVLVEQEIIAEIHDFDYDLRVVSNNPVLYEYDTTKGWYMDLLFSGNGPEGERVVDFPLLHGGHLIFNSIIPSGSPCEFGGSSWLYEIDPLTGGRAAYSIFDLNDDDLFDQNDFVTIEVDGEKINVPVSGKKTQSGISTTPGVITAGTKEFKLSSTSSGEIETTIERPDSSDSLGRSSWRQVR